MRHTTRSVLGLAAHGLGLIGAATARPDLFNNGPYVTNPGAGQSGADVSLMQTTLSCQSYGFTCQGAPAAWRVADDFTVTASGGWTISSVVFYCFQPGAGIAVPTVNSACLRIWSGRPGDAGSTVLFGDTTTNRFLSSAWSGAYRAPDTDITSANRPIFAVEVSVSPGLHLAPGTYWLQWAGPG